MDKMNSFSKVARTIFGAVNTAEVLKLRVKVYSSFSSYIDGVTYKNTLERSQPFPNGL